MDVIKEAAQMKCLGDCNIPLEHQEHDDSFVGECSCQGTGLKHPTLSRESADEDGAMQRYVDVTLEKVFDCGVVGVWWGDEKGCWEAVADGSETCAYGDTPLLAACAALLRC